MTINTPATKTSPSREHDQNTVAAGSPLLWLYSFGKKSEVSEHEPSIRNWRCGRVLVCASSRGRWCAFFRRPPHSTTSSSGSKRPALRETSPVEQRVGQNLIALADWDLQRECHHLHDLQPATNACGSWAWVGLAECLTRDRAVLSDGEWFGAK